MLSEPTPSLERMVARLRLHSSLSEDEGAAILSLRSHPRSIRRGHSVKNCQQEDGEVHLVAAGLIGSFEQTRDGRRQIIALHIHGDLTNLSTLMITDAAFEMGALSDSVITVVARSDLLSLVDTHPAIGTALWRDCAADARVLAKWAVNIGRKDARSRLAHLLCEMACRFGKAGSEANCSFDLPMTQHDMADSLAMTAVHLNRVLQGLRQDGYVRLKGRTVELLDWEAMLAIGDFDWRYLRHGQAQLQ